MENHDQKVNVRYGLGMISLHWFVALGIVLVFGMGLYLGELHGISPLKLRLINWHKWLGVTIFALVGLRLVVRLSSTLPGYPAHWSANQVRLIHAGHWMLYVLMAVVPLSGYFYSLAAGFPVVWFGVLPLPVFIGKDPMLKEILSEVHELLAWGLAVLVVGHVLMALKHHCLDRDGLLKRMLPSCKGSCKK